MGTPLKLLTVGLVLATAAMAGCSSTTGSSGAVQDDASSAASSSSAASTGPAPSPDPVTPTAGPTGATASPTATPTDSPSPSGSSAPPVLLGSTPVDVCDLGMPYQCGGYGQSGVGTVFYASTASFACGANMESSCNYLEMAPNMWNPNSSSTCKQATGTSCGGSLQTTSDFSSTGLGFEWCTGSGGNEIINGSQQVMGSGFANTTVMLPVCNPGDAGNVARSYTGGGLTDWSLASMDELNALYYYSGRAGVGGFNSGGYWSSSQGSRGIAHYQVFAKAGQGSDYKDTAYGVRPVRAF
jgi:hypothetical protein